MKQLRLVLQQQRLCFGAGSRNTPSALPAVPTIPACRVQTRQSSKATHCLLSRKWSRSCILRLVSPGSTSLYSSLLSSSSSSSTGAVSLEPALAARSARQAGAGTRAGSSGHPRFSGQCPAGNMDECLKTLLVTANVGSIFEEPETMFPQWLKAFFQCLQHHKPDFLALHCQEVGGKNYEASMQHVDQFVKTLLASEELHKYDRARIFLDEDYTASDKFTALGNLYFIHEEVSDVLIWDFVDCKFVAVEGRELLSGNIENTPIKEKAKFPQHFFPEFKWSRKGFIRTRWSINSSIFDLVNIHLFHDACNIVAMEKSPSVYSENRQRALLHTLQRFESDKHGQVPLFIFGDFNFRLDSYLLIQELTSKLVANQITDKKGHVNKTDFTETGNGKVILTIGSKDFDYYDKHSDLFSKMFKKLQQYDTELSCFKDQLHEYEINFPPSYPFCEDVADGVSYMKTRVPSWCDRVLLTHSAKETLIEESCKPAVYDLMGKDVCMGDHKPAYLFVHLKPGKGNCHKSVPNLSGLSTTTLLIPPQRKHFLSINGEVIETVDDQLSDINIHDFAVFEEEQQLIPEFRKSIKNKAGSERQGSSDDGSLRPSSTLARSRSFQEVANKVRTLEKVLMKWPKRPASRHHSSSSEDFVVETLEVSSLSSVEAGKVEAGKVEAGKVEALPYGAVRPAVSPSPEANNNTPKITSRVSFEVSSDSQEEPLEADKEIDEVDKERAEAPVKVYGQPGGCGQAGLDECGQHEAPAPPAPPAPAQPASSPAASAAGCCSCVVI